MGHWHRFDVLAKRRTPAAHARMKFTAACESSCSMFVMPSSRYWIAIPLPTSSRSRYANIDATKLLHRFCTDRVFLHRCCLKNGSRFVAGKEGRQAIAFQSCQRTEPTIIQQACGEAPESHLNQTARSAHVLKL